MKTLSVLFLTVSAFGADTSLNGEWQIQRMAEAGDSTETCEFTQKETELTGTCSAEKGPVKLKGKVDQNKVTWTITTESSDGGGRVTIIYDGTIDSERMSGKGKVTAVEYNIEGRFKASRVR